MTIVELCNRRIFILLFLVGFMEDEVEIDFGHFAPLEPGGH